jgi:CHAT domain-containing protein
MSSTAPALSTVIEQAERLWKQGDLGRAFETYRHALHVTENEPAEVTAADVVALERFADLAVLSGQMEAAEQALSVMADLCEASGNVYGKDYAALKTVLALHQNGQIRRALALMYSLAERFGNLDAIQFEPALLEEWETAVQWPDTDDDDRAVIFALFYLAASRLAASLGQYRNARQAARRGAVHATSNTLLAQRYRIPLLLSESLAALESGGFEQATALLNQAGANIDAKRDPGFHFEYLELTAKLAMLRGDLGAALERLSKTVELAAQCSSSVQAACLQNLAAFQILINQTVNAEQTLEHASVLVGGSDFSQCARIAQLRLMAELRARSFAEDFSGSITSIWEGVENNPDRQSETLMHIGESGEQHADFLAWFEQRTLEFYLVLGDGRIQLAAQMLAAIHDCFGGTDSEVVQLRTAYLDALLAYYQGQYARANEVLSVLLPLLEGSGLLHDLWQARRLASWIARRGRASKATIDAAMAEENRTLTKLAASLDPVSRAIFLLNKWTTEEETIAALVDAAIVSQNKPPSRFAPLRWWRTLQTWRQTLAVENCLEAGKRALAETAGGASQTSTRPLRLLDLWRQSHKEAYVTFSALPDRLIAIVRTRRAARIHILEVSRIELRQAVKAWHERMLAPAAAAARRTDPLSKELNSILANLPPAVRELRLRPDDALHGYPFAALTVDGAPIIQRYAISLWHAAAAPRKTASSRTALVLAATQPLGEYPALRNAAAEAANISKMLSGFGFNVRTLTDEAACKTEAAAALGQSTIAHIACHGRFQPDQPARTGLVLVGPGGSPETLSIKEIGAIDCSNLEHITLSACWSADNFVVPGRWIFSLPETLCRAGARSVLGSLWEADDRLAGAFMRRFYGNLAQLTRAEALREVQVACLHNQLEPGLDTSDPIYWANFYLFGESGKLLCN